MSEGPGPTPPSEPRETLFSRFRAERHASKAYRHRPRLMVTVAGIGNASVILGTREAIVVKAEIVTGTAGEWIDAMQLGGRVTVRTSAITAAWVDE